MGLGLVFFIVGVVVILALYLWTQQRRSLGDFSRAERQSVQKLPAVSSDDAVLVSREHGQIVYANERARRWLGMNGGAPDLEHIAGQVQPSDSFLQLFSGERQASFQLGRRWVEASSHSIPAGSETRTVVVMREIAANTSQTGGFDLSRAIQIINEIGETVNASMSVEQVHQALLAIVMKAVPAEAGELCRWDEHAHMLFAHAWVGDSNYLIQLQEIGGGYKYGEGISGWIAQERRPLLVTSVSDVAAVQPRLSGFYRSFVGVPLLLGDRLLGTFELSHSQDNHFRQTELALLQAVSKQIAIAIYNAELYGQQSQRINDMASLQNLTQRDFSAADPRNLYAALNERIADMVGAEMSGVLIYDENRRALRPELPFHGLPDQLAANLSIPLPPDSPQRDIWENQDYWITNDLGDEPLIEALGLKPMYDVASIRNTALMPLQIGDTRIGMIQIMNKRAAGGFTSQDVRELRVLVAQAAIVVGNLRLHQQEKQRDTELSGVQEITHAIGTLTREEEFYGSITERIAGLMGMQMCGILLFDDEKHQLVSRLPFYGVSDETVSDYHIDVTPGSPLASIWEEVDYWYANQVQSNAVVYAAGLADFAAKLGVTKTLLAVMAIGGRRIGVVQISNKLNGEDFTDKDARLLLIFGSQAAALIENARLYRDIRHSADEAIRLQKVAELAGAIRTSDDLMTPLLAEIASLTRSPLVFISNLDAQAGSLTVYPRWVQGTELLEPVVDTFDGLRPTSRAAVSQQHVLSNDLAGSPDLRDAYDNLIDRLGLHSAVILPLELGDHCFGELGIANRDSAPYEDDDLRLAEAIAAPVAAMVERLRLYESTGENLNRRILELDAISRISNELTQTVDLDRVLDVIRREAEEATRADGSTVALLRPPGAWQNPEKPELLRRVGELLGVAGLTDIEREAARRGAETVTVPDYGPSIMQAEPADARSGLAAAFVYEDEVIGVIHVYHHRAAAFDERAATFLLTAAAKAAVGFGNYRRYHEQLDRSNRLRRRVEQLNQIFELGQMLQSNVDPVTLMESVLYSIQHSVGFDAGVALLVDEEAGVLRRVAQVGMPIDEFESSKEHVFKLEDLQKLLQDTYRISESFFFPLEQKADWTIGALEALRMGFSGRKPLTQSFDKRAWRDGDLLLIPIRTAEGSLRGLMSLDRPQDRQRPDRGTLEVLEIFSHQATTTLENIRLYLDSIHNAEQEARLSEMLEEMSRTLDTTEIAQTVARGVLRLLPFRQMAVALEEAEGHGFDLVHVTFAEDGTLTFNIEHRPHLEDTSFMQAMTGRRDSLYQAEDRVVQNYDDLRGWIGRGIKTMLALPLVTGGRALGAVLIGSDQNDPSIFEETRPLLKRMANLMAIEVENARLLTRAMNLQAFNESVVESIQQGIVVLDRSARIMSINAFMRQRYAWDTAAALRKDLLAFRPELADLLKDSLRRVLELGEPSDRLIETAATADGQLLVRNFYAYPLRGGDAIRGAVLLVEDITEQALLERKLEARANQLAALTEVSSRITASLNREDVINLALTEIGRVIRFDTMTLWTRHDDILVLEGSAGIEDELAQVAGDMTHIHVDSHPRLKEVVQRRAPLVMPQLDGSAPLPGESHAQTWLGVPLVNQGNVIGLLSLARNVPGAYDSQAEQAAFAFANQVAIALDNAILYEDAHYRSERLGLLNRVSVELAQSLDSENILEIALREIASMAHVSHARALTFERDRQIARVIVNYPRGDEPPDERMDMQLSPVCQKLRQSAVPLLIDDVSQLTTGDPIRSELESRAIHSFMMIPMTVGGQVIGAFELSMQGRPHRFTAEQVDLGLIIANQAAIAVQNTNLLEQTLVRARELETLLEAAQVTSLTLSLEDAFRSVADLILHALEMNDCAVMMWDNVENTLQVEISRNDRGEEDVISPRGSQYDLRHYPARMRCLEDNEIIVIRTDDEEQDEVERTELQQTGNATRVLIPLVVRDQSIGLLQGHQHDPDKPFSNREMRLARALGIQAAIAIQNARLSTETAALVEEGFMINNLSQAISSTLTIEDMIQVVREQVPQVTEAEELYLALFDPETQSITFPMAVRRGKDIEIPPRIIGRDEVSFIIRHRRSLSLGGGAWSSDEMRRNLGIVNGEDEARSYLGVPVASGDQVLGVLALRDTENTRAFGINDERLLMTVGTQLGAAMQNARLFRQVSNFAEELNERVRERTVELQQERDRLDTLYRITSELARTLDMDRVLRRALEMVSSAVEAEDGVIMLIDPLSDSLVTRSSLRGDTSDQHPAHMIASWLVQNARVRIVGDLTHEEYWDASRPGAEQWRSALSVLLESNEDPQGVMVMLSTQPAAFTDAQLKLVIAAASQVAAAINNADLYHLIRDQAERLGMLVRLEQEEAEKNSAIVEGIADGVMLADSEGAIVLFNSAAERVLDLPRDQVIGQGMFRLTGLFGGSSTRWQEVIEGWSRDPESSRRGSFLSETLDLGRKVVRVTMSPVHIGERFLGTVSVFRDITKEVEVDRIKSEFVSNVSHELRTPMTSIKGFADLLLMGVVGSVTDQQRNFLTKIKSNADRLSQLVDDLLNISRLDAGERLNIELIDLREILPNIMANLESRSEHEKKHMNVSVEIDPALPPFEADPHKITQIITNLVDNAFNYTYAGGNIDVAARFESAKNRILITVKDTGIGIPEEFQARIWQRFERYEDHALVMDVPGTGLGLAIVKELVDRHHGEIRLDSEQGKGTTFFVEMPVEQPK